MSIRIQYWQMKPSWQSKNRFVTSVIKWQGVKENVQL